MTSTKIEFGCGGRKMEDWLCTEIDECDISKTPLAYNGVAFNSDHFEMVYASHVAEHINTHQCLAFFKEVYRILKVGGTFRIIVPTLERVKTREHACDLIVNHGHQINFSKESLKSMLWAAGFERAKIRSVSKNPTLDVHDAQIGVEKDFIESERVEATK